MGTDITLQHRLFPAGRTVWDPLFPTPHTEVLLCSQLRGTDPNCSHQEGPPTSHLPPPSTVHEAQKVSSCPLYRSKTFALSLSRAC